MTERELGMGLILAGAVACLWLAGAWFTRATPADIAACQNATGWPLERCRAEINR